MKIVLTSCDLLTIVLLWRWLAITGRNEWLALAYAWNPLVVLEVAHSGHIDALGAMWIAASALWLTRRRTALASIAFTLAVATKLLPIVLAPLFLGRVRFRDVALGVRIADRAVPAVHAVARSTRSAPCRTWWPIFDSTVRFSARSPGSSRRPRQRPSPCWWAWAQRPGRDWRLDASDPAAWAWPMALALACAPVIYPWYLLYFTPFLVTRATVPLAVWTYAVLPVYVVWERARGGARWRVPNELMIAEYGLVVAAAIVVLVVATSRSTARDAVVPSAPIRVPKAASGAGSWELGRLNPDQSLAPDSFFINE